MLLTVSLDMFCTSARLGVSVSTPRALCSMDIRAGQIKYHLCMFMYVSEPDSLEVEEAISKGTFQHDVTNLEPATTYSLYLKAYSPLGASQHSQTVVATTLGGGKDLSFRS